MRCTCLLLGLLVFTLLPARAGHSAPKVLFRIHVQTTGAGMSAQESTSIPIPPDGEEIQVRTLPEVTEGDIIDIKQDAGGVHFQFDHQGMVNLSAVTAQNQGRILVVFIDNTLFYSPVIDTQISNGRLDIPYHLSPQIFVLLQEVAQKNAHDAGKS